MATPISGDGPASVRFSVIVPVYRDWHRVPGLLECLKRQTFPASLFEVILVDNGSPDFAPPSELPENTHILRCEKPGSYAARNEGVGHSRGEWLAFTDADCLPAPEWLRALDEEARRHGQATLIAGAVEVVSLSRAPSAPEIHDVVRGIPQDYYVRRGYAATANLAVPRAVFDAVGGFDAGRFSGGDADFCRRAGAEGVAVVYAPRARVDHPARATWRAVAAKARRIKGGQIARGSPLRRAAWGARTFFPPVLDVWRLLRATRHPPRRRLVAVAVQVALWGVEMDETIRLLAGGQAKRQ